MKPYILCVTFGMILMLGLYHCGCPSDQAVNNPVDLPTNHWTEKIVESEETNETYSYLELEPTKENLPILVLVHGMNIGPWTFRNVAGLAEQFHVYSWSIPDSSDFYEGKPDDIPKAFADYLNTMGFEQVLLGGYSMGGGIILRVLFHLDSIKVNGMILMNTQIPNLTKRDIRGLQRLGRFMLRKDDEDLICLIKRQVQEEQEEHATMKPEQNIFSVFQLPSVSYYRAVFRSLAHADEKHGAELVTCPTLIIHASEDESITKEAPEEIKQFIPHARIVILEGLHHDGIFMNGELYTQHIIKWWQNNTESS